MRKFLLKDENRVVCYMELAALIERGVTEDDYSEVTDSKMAMGPQVRQRVVWPWIVGGSIGAAVAVGSLWWFFA